MGLVIAFTFSGAASRFDHRRDLTVEEANDIGTAYLRIELLPEAARGPLRDKFREYVDARLQTYRVGTDVVRISELLQQTAQYQRSDLENGRGSHRPCLESTRGGADSSLVE